MVLWTPFGIGIAILNCLVGVAAFLKVNIAKWVLKENIKGWDPPKYEKLLRE
jgi:hypothetical protein